MIACRLFTPAEFRVREDERREAISEWKVAHPDVDLAAGWPAELIALNDGFFPPGSMWFCPWYHDPSKPEDLAKVDDRIASITANPDGHHHLSIHYWRDWARIRPPIEVVCPGGGQWCPDQKSSNGTGWTVTGEAPLLVCSPSIWVAQGQGPPREYHGFLGQNGAPPGHFSGPV